MHKTKDKPIKQKKIQLHKDMTSFKEIQRHLMLKLNHLQLVVHRKLLCFSPKCKTFYSATVSMLQGLRSSSSLRTLNLSYWDSLVHSKDGT